MTVSNIALFTLISLVGQELSSDALKKIVQVFFEPLSTEQKPIAFEKPAFAVEPISPPETLSAANLSPSTSSKIRPLDSVEQPLSLINIVALNLLFSSLAGIIVFLLCRQIVIFRVVEEVKQKLQELNLLNQQIITATTTSEKLNHELLQEFNLTKQAAQKEMQILKIEFENHKKSLKQFKALKDQCIFQLQKITLDAQEAKENVIARLSKITATQILEALKPEIQQQINIQQWEQTNLQTKIDSAGEYVKQGEMLYHTGRYQEAVICYDQALKINQNFYEAWYNRAIALAKLDKYEDALLCYDQAISLQSNKYEPLYNKGNLLVRLQRYEQALTYYDKTLALKPDIAEAWHNKAAVLAKLQRDEEALAAYNNAIKLKADKYESWYNRGNLLVKLQQYEEAIKSYDNALTLQNNRAEIWHNRAIVLEKIQQTELALESYKKAISIQPNFAEIWHNQGKAFENLRQYEQAINSYNKALEIQPKNVEFWQSKAKVMEKINCYEEAISCYDKVIDLQPENFEAWYCSANALWNLHRYEEALVSYERAIKIKPDEYEAWYSRGNLLASLHQYQEALASFSKAFQIQQNLTVASL